MATYRGIMFAMDIADRSEWGPDGLPVHLYPFPITIGGQGPADPEDAFRMICWCGTDGCLGTPVPSNP